MSTWPMVKFVDAPSATANLRFDCNDLNAAAPRRVAAFDPGVPTLEGDPDAVGQQWGFRSPSVTVRVKGSKANALAALSALSREQLRQTNWVMFQLSSTTSPVWLRTYRTGYESLSLDRVYVRKTDGGTEALPDTWDITVPLVADAFAYGAQATLSTITIANDPAAGTNPLSVTLPAIKGDAPTPLRIKVNPSNSNGSDGYKFMFSMLSTTGAVTVPIVWQVGSATTDGWTAGTDTAASASDATMSGGFKRRVSFATDATMVTRLSGNAPAALPAGKYKHLVRVARSDTNSTFAMRLGQSLVGSYFYGDTAYMDRAASTAAGHATYVDLGDFQHPRDFYPADGNLGVGNTTPNISLQVQRLSGTGQLDIDAFVLVPLETASGYIDSQTLYTYFPTIGIASGAGFGMFDGDTGSVWGYTAFGFPEAGLRAECQGGFPRAVPGAVNTLHFLQQVNGRKSFFGQDTADLITVTTALDISYYPLYLYIGDGT